MAFLGFFRPLTIFILIKLAQVMASCDLDTKLANGKVTETASWFGGDNIEFECTRGYSLQGKRWHLGSGKILKRYCAKAGCEDFEKPENGVISTAPGGLKAVITCDANFALSGNPLTYCNGSQWLLPLGTCQAQDLAGDYSCDFEREDLCGWKASKAIPQPWQRIRAAADLQKKNCLRQDHTFQSDVQGHFIRLQSQVHAFRTYHFMSPILPRNLTAGNSLRFQFQLFMFGTGVKSLTVSVKPGSMPAEDMWKTFRGNSTKLVVSGNQGARWQSHSVHIDEMDTDFQVVFTFADPSSLNGSIGIDDVDFINGRL
ncbi:MAM and LDL-receptor class A domain-containing protein 1-like [Drosophila biarmipes]|uniref:MAM and LDL-receptor class A domain-containing protein 1-like n=1 Tax=Drosophila biarmipes TaxID=125945 RepID=UPI0007E6BBC1|nr:MAM and LDL-receptor class A domain-containing protein 1-like [Drosophila biarmipes]